MNQENTHEKTANQRGYMHPMSETSKSFVRFSKTINSPVVDIGCAYGINSIAALKAGASKVIACDMEMAHLNALQERARDISNVKERLMTKLAVFPDGIDFAANSIGAVLTHYSLPYLTIDALESGLQKVYNWLEVGGKLFICNYSVYIKELANEKFNLEYKRRVDAGIKWPGDLEDFNAFSSMAEQNEKEGALPKRIHFLDKESTLSTLLNIGFTIEEAKYIDGKANGAVEETIHDGRELLSIIARK